MVASASARSTRAVTSWVIAAAASPASGIELRRPSLEDIFISIVQEDATDAETAEQLRASVRAGTAEGGAR